METESIGQQILEAIIEGNMVRAEAVGDSMLFIWNGNAAEQLEAVVEEFYKDKK